MITKLKLFFVTIVMITNVTDSTILSDKFLNTVSTGLYSKYGRNRKQLPLLALQEYPNLLLWVSGCMDTAGDTLPLKTFMCYFSSHSPLLKPRGRFTGQREIKHLLTCCKSNIIKAILKGLIWQTNKVFKSLDYFLSILCQSLSAKCTGAGPMQMGFRTTEQHCKSLCRLASFCSWWLKLTSKHSPFFCSYDQYNSVLGNHTLLSHTCLTINRTISYIFQHMTGSTLNEQLCNSRVILQPRPQTYLFNREAHE